MVTSENFLLGQSEASDASIARANVGYPLAWFNRVSSFLISAISASLLADRGERIGNAC
jgi:hypothetical protein